MDINLNPNSKFCTQLPNNIKCKPDSDPTHEAHHTLDLNRTCSNSNLQQHDDIGSACVFGQVAESCPKTKDEFDVRNNLQLFRAGKDYELKHADAVIMVPMWCVVAIIVMVI